MSKVGWAIRYSNGIWVYRIGPLQGLFGQEGKKKRYLFATQREALEMAATIVHPPVKLVKVTRRPKPAPELRVGDEVLVRARVQCLSSKERAVCVTANSGRLLNQAFVRVAWFPDEDIIRAPKEK